MPICVFCRGEVEVRGPLGRRETCPHCRRDLHCCLQCGSFEENAYHQCREPNSELIEDKETANYCDFFRFGRELKDESTEKATVKSKLERLFKK